MTKSDSGRYGLPVFNGGNKMGWPQFYQRYRAVLKVEKILDVIDNYIEDTSDMDVKKATKQSEDDAKATMILLNCLDGGPFELVESMESARDMVMCLEEHYRSNSTN